MRRPSSRLAAQSRPQSAQDETILRAFEDAAGTYDRAASLQAEIARTLLGFAAARMSAPSPASILDIGCGTGHVTARAARLWPQAALTALDTAPGMLKQVAAKTPQARMIAADAAAYDAGERYDLILSSMALHWLSEPRDVLERWSAWLNPGGRVVAAFPVEGSLREWKELCAAHGVEDGVRQFPPHDFARDIARRAMLRRHMADFPSAHAFLRHLKDTGTSTPRPGHAPMPADALRRILRDAPGAFRVSYNVLYVEIVNSGL